MPRRKRATCEHCGRDFRADNLKRHLRTCAARLRGEAASAAGDLRTALRASEAKDALIESLAARVSELCSANRRLVDRLLDANAQLADLARPASTTIINLSVHMTPWCLDPAAPEYQACLQSDAAEVERDVRAVVAAEAAAPAAPDDRLLDDDFRAGIANAKKRRAFLDATRRRVLAATARPRYIVPDLARHKGMFVMPDGSCRFDDGMAMLMRHQERVFVRSGAGPYLKRSTRRSLRRSLASDAHAAAKRIRADATTPPNGGRHPDGAVAAPTGE